MQQKRLREDMKLSPTLRVTGDTPVRSMMTALALHYHPVNSGPPISEREKRNGNTPPDHIFVIVAVTEGRGLCAPISGLKRKSPTPASMGDPEKQISQPASVYARREPVCKRMNTLNVDF